MSDPDRRALAEGELAAIKAMLGRNNMAQYRGHFRARIDGEDMLHIATR